MRVITDPLYRHKVAGACLRKYQLLIGPFRAEAKRLGYAIAVHGSLVRDIDLVAIPWTVDAVPAAELIDALIVVAEQHAGFVFLNPNDKNPDARPHGRVSWSVHVGSGTYFDISVMPRRSA